MSVLGKLMFWKKEPGYKDFGEPPGLGPELGLPPAPTDDLGLPPLPGEESKPYGAPSFPNESPAGKPSSFDQRQYPNQQGPMAPPSYAPVPVQQAMPMAQSNSKDIEVVSVKVDSIRQQLEMVNHRLERIERMLERRY